ncbi:MAG: ABC transporter ATP-binding protein [Syntrophotaleaceae bacterium]
MNLAPIQSEPASGPEVVSAADLFFRYPGGAQAAVAGLSLSVPEGAVFGLLGPNGAGKTTTIAMLSNLLRPAAGSLRVCGVDLMREPHKVRRQIGLVPQEVALYPTLTVKENLRYFGRLFGMGGRDLNRRMDECLDMVGLRDHGDSRIETFSGGMKRRANLAAGIVHRPRLLFLDEPTVGIDPQSRSTILENLFLLQKEGMTLIYTTHYMEEAQRLCSRLAIIDGGRVIAEGLPEELIAAGDGCRNLEDLFLQLTGRQLRD